MNRKQKECWFFHSKSGCKHGRRCHFRHSINPYSDMGYLATLVSDMLTVFDKKIEKLSDNLTMNLELLWGKLGTLMEDEKEHCTCAHPKPPEPPDIPSKAVLDLTEQMRELSTQNQAILCQLKHIQNEVDMGFIGVDLKQKSIRTDMQKQLNANNKNKDEIIQSNQQMIRDTFIQYFVDDNVSNDCELYDEADALFISIDMIKDKVSSLENAFNDFIVSEQTAERYDKCKDMAVSSEYQVEKITKKMCKDTLILESKDTSKCETNIDADLAQLGFTRTGDCWTVAEVQRFLRMQRSQSKEWWDRMNR